MKKKTKMKKNQKKFPANNFSKMLRENKVIIFLFLLSTSFFVWTHYVYVSWDFSTYVLNAKYIFDGGSYFEILRPPLMPVILGILSFAGWKAAEFIFIILASALFAYSSSRLAKSINFSPAVFYAISLNLFLLNFGLVNGTELLSLALLELSVALLIEGKPVSGLFLGLSALARYTSIAFFPLILLHLNTKKITKSIMLFGGIIAAWLVYCFYKTGNFFTSLADQYANNILYRGYTVQNFQPRHILEVQNILLLFFLLGVILAAINLWKKIAISKKSGRGSLFEFVGENKAAIAMLFLLSYSLWSYASIPLKDSRYLFNLILPTVYFSYIGLAWIAERFVSEKKEKKNTLLNIFAAAVFGVSTLILLSLYPVEDHDPSSRYYSAIDKMGELNMSGCYVMSNSWTKLNYYGQASAPFPRRELAGERINEGKIIILFSHEPEPSYTHDGSYINSLPILYKNEEYSIIGKKECIPSSAFDESYVEQVAADVSYMRNSTINTNPCFTMFRNASLLEKTCNFVNFNGFRKDENRVLE